MNELYGRKQQQQQQITIVIIESIHLFSIDKNVYDKFQYKFNSTTTKKWNGVRIKTIHSFIHYFGHLTNVPIIMNIHNNNLLKIPSDIP